MWDLRCHRLGATGYYFFFPAKILKQIWAFLGVLPAKVSRKKKCDNGELEYVLGMTSKFRMAEGPKAGLYYPAFGALTRSAKNTHCKNAELRRLPRSPKKRFSREARAEGGRSVIFLGEKKIFPLA